MNTENQNIEFKESWRDEYLKWICGFANAQGGKLFVGIDDGGNVVGVENAHRLSEDIPNKIVSLLGVVAEVNILQKEGIDYIEIVTLPSNVPISYRGKYYYRSGSTLQELNGSALTDFLFRKTHTTWDQHIVEEGTLDDIDSEAIDYFLGRAVAAKRLDESATKLTSLQTLQKLKLVNKDNKMTIAALLLFGKDIERWNLMSAFRIGRFQHTQDNLLIQDHIACPLIKMPETILWTLRNNYLVAPIHYEGLQRVEPLEIPEDALREMICNAIVHKNYSGPFIQMRVWDDRVELWNYGELPIDYTIEKLLQTHESFPRNPLIAQAFYLAGFIEQWGRGYEKIHDAFIREHLLQPTFEQVRGGILVTVQRERFVAIRSGKHIERMEENKLKQLIEGINEGINDESSQNGVEKSDLESGLKSVQESEEKTTQKTQQKSSQKSTLESTLKSTLKGTLKRIVESIEDNPNITIDNVAELLQMNRRGIVKHFKNLQAQGIIRRVGPDKGGHWEIIKED